jgi:hypothetical protein
MAHCHEQIAASYYTDREPSKALEHYSAACASGARVFGEDSSEVAGYFEKMAAICDELGESDRASTYREKANAIRQTVSAAEGDPFAELEGESSVSAEDFLPPVGVENPFDPITVPNGENEPLAFGDRLPDAQIVTVDVEGIGMTQQEAVEDALDRALGHVFGYIVEGPDSAGGEDVPLAIPACPADASLKGYTVISESVLDGLVRVRIRADVDRGRSGERG